MSHHFDSPTALEDGRLNLTDVYAFPGPGDATTLIANVNPDAGRSSPTTLRSDALYEFAIASDGGTVEDRAIRMTVDEPDADGRQRMTVRLATGEDARHGVSGTRLGAGGSREGFDLDGGGRAWFGVAADPFWGDGFALAAFFGRLAENDYRPDVFTASPANVFDRRNVTAIALQVPNALLGGDRVAIWARISLYGHAPQRQVSRMGHPMLRPLFFQAPGPDSEELNAGQPADDLSRHAARLEHIAAKVAALRGIDDVAGHASAVARAFLPDVLIVRPGQPARYEPGAGNGRALHDDAFGMALSVLAGVELGASTSPYPVVADFPHLAPASTDDLPALLELFGLRGPATPAAGNDGGIALSVREARPADRATLPDIWLRSVRATHAFLGEDEIQALLPLVRDELASDELELWILSGDEDAPVGFMGLADAKVEALFLDPDHRRRGGGRLLIDHARRLKGALAVDVNEQNPEAIRFYEAVGFETVGRSPLDDAGRPYPLLHMRQRAA